MGKEDIYAYGEKPKIKSRRRHIPLFEDSVEALLQDLDDAQVKAKLRKIVWELFDEWVEDFKKKNK